MNVKYLQDYSASCPLARKHAGGGELSAFLPEAVPYFSEDLRRQRSTWTKTNHNLRSARIWALLSVLQGLVTHLT